MRTVSLLAAVCLGWCVSSVGAAERGGSWVERVVENQAECGSICRRADPAITYCYYWPETKMCRVTDNRLPNTEMRGPYGIYEVSTNRWLTPSDVAAIIAANPPPPLANLAGRWAYRDGQGQMTLTQTGNEVVMELIWVASSVPPPHYTVKAWLTDGWLSGWWFCDHRQSCPKKWLPFEASVDEGGREIAVRDGTEDPSGEGWSGLKMYRRP